MVNKWVSDQGRSIDKNFSQRKIGEKTRKKKFKDFEKVYNRVNRKALWQVVRTLDLGGKLFIGIKEYVNSLTCVRIKEGEN